MLSILLLAAPVAGWVSRSQSVYGAQISEIQAMMLGKSTGRSTPQAELGYLWYAPADTLDTRGLGGGITWAFDPELCHMLKDQFREDIFGMNDFISCNEYKAAIARAFDKWSANNRFIKFLDVTEECRSIGKLYGPPTSNLPAQDGPYPHGACQLAEIWVTSIGSSSRRQMQEQFKTRRNPSIGPDGKPMKPEEEDPNLPNLADFT